ncbi:MAG: DUF6970 domain-containing protein [bacterium]
MDNSYTRSILLANHLPHADGGFSGWGDGKCPDFYSEKRDEVIIWEDKRTYPPSDDSQLYIQGPLGPKPGDSNLLRHSVYVRETDLLLLESFPVQVRLLLKGSLSTPCHQLRAKVSKPDNQNRIMVDLYSLVEPDIPCIDVEEPFEETISLGSYKYGAYTIWVNGEKINQFDLNTSYADPVTPLYEE